MINQISTVSPKIFITGISGFIGSELAERLLVENYKVAGLIRQSTRENEAIKKLRGRVDFYQGDLRDYWVVKKTLDDFKPDYIFHLGAITPVSYSFEHPHEVTEVNYIGVINLIEAAKQTTPLLKKFIFAGSMEEYGYQVHEPFTENLILRPACPYAVAKVAAEKYIQYSHYAFGFPGIILRQTNAYGRKENDYFVVESIITKMLKNSYFVNLGRKEPVRNFIYIDDVLDAWITVMRTEHINGEVFNLGPANGLSIEELANKIAIKLDWKGQINWNTHELRPGEIFYLNSSNEKLTKATGWSPKVTLDEGLNKTINYWKNKLL